ncbi:MAG TPA: peptidylprolyl isomerase [Myxococcaceae bacterium]|jgi:cyclophilin family peptidyl-prolyl cis-trans isomerase/HEAT repeat protein
MRQLRPPALALAAALAASSGCVTTGSSTRATSPEVAELERLEDQRSLGGGRLGALAASADPAVRARAMVALGRIQDPSSIPFVQQGLQDQDATVRDRAAFAAGLFGMSWVPLPGATREALASAVVAADAANPGDGPRRSFIDAMARLGGTAGSQGLVAIVKAAGAGDERLSRAIIGLALQARRDGKMVDAPLQAVLQRWGDSAQRPRLRYSLAYALATSKSPAVRAQAVECAQVRGPEERREDEQQAVALCVRALIEAGTEADVALVRAALGHRDYRVAAEATRVLVRFAQRAKDNPARATAAIAALGDLSGKVDLLAKGHVADGAQPLLQLAKLDLPDEGQGVIESLRQQLQARQQTAKGQVALDLARMDCRLAAAQDSHQGSLAQVLTCGAGLPPETWRLSLALGQIEHGPQASLAANQAPPARYLSHASPTVRAAALGAVAKVKDASAKDAVLGLLDDPDISVAASAAGAAAALGDARAIPGILKLSAQASRSPDIGETIASALMDLKAPQAQDLLVGWLQQPHAHLRHVAAQSLEKMGVTLPAVSPQVAEPVAYSPAPDGAELDFATAKGSFTVKLDTRENPRTAANLWGLAKKGFFNGLTFHRVEPDFVIQGGDPRGDGDGGPGYTIRCEVSDRRYVRGTIGMALSGKDTGGSQFFFTTSEQPHLEGRYTAFGQVTEGEGVLDDVLEGEAITRVTAKP